MQTIVRIKRPYGLDRTTADFRLPTAEYAEGGRLAGSAGIDYPRRIRASRTIVSSSAYSQYSRHSSSRTIHACRSPWILPWRAQID